MDSIFPRLDRSRLRTAALTVAVLLAFGCGERVAPEPAPVMEPAPLSNPPEPRAASTVRLLFLGDSISAGYGLAEDDAYPAVVGRILRAEGYDVEVLNAGVSGDTTAGGLARLDWVLRSDPDVIVVQLGANDALRGQPLKNTESNLRAIVRGAGASGARVLLVGMDVPTNYGPDYAGGFAELYERIAVEEGVDLAPAFMREVGVDPNLMQGDGLHPTADGHRRLAGSLVPHLRAILERPTGSERTGDGKKGRRVAIAAAPASVIRTRTVVPISVAR